MKRAKSLATFLTVTSLLFGSSMPCFATDTDLTDSKTEVLIQSQQVEKLMYTVRTYIDSNNRIIGYYPVLSYINGLSNEILENIDNAVSELNLSASDSYSEDIVKFYVDESLEGYAKVVVIIEKDDLVNSFDYYIDKKLNIQITKAEFEKVFEDSNDSSTSGSAIEIIMVPLRVNAEKLGWKVDWEQKKSHEPSKAILSKDSKLIKIMIDAGLDYDLIINEDIAKDFVKTEKLDKAAELQDSTLYIPSTFLDKYLFEATTSSSLEIVK